MKLTAARKVLGAELERQHRVRGLLDTQREQLDAEAEADEILTRRYIDLVRGVRDATTLHLGRVPGWSVSEPIPVSPPDDSRPLYVRFFLEERPGSSIHDSVAAHWSDAKLTTVPSSKDELLRGVPGVFSTEIVEKEWLTRPAPNADPTDNAIFRIALHNLVLLEQSLAAVNGDQQ